MSLTTQTDFTTAVQKATAAAAAYYDTDTQLIPDVEYDALIDDIAAAITAHPDWATPDALALIEKVAAGVSTAGDVPHPTPMLSLDKAADMDAVTKFVQRGAARQDTYTVEPKMDGLAVRAEYADGQLVRVVTRGNGQSGEDVTAQALRAPGITGLPATITDSGLMEVRGEVYMTDADFDASNVNRVAAGKPTYANPRNATAGALRNTDLGYDVHMSFAAYSVTVDRPPFQSHALLMATLDRLGIRTAQSLMPGYDPKNPARAELVTATAVEKAITALHEARPTLGFPIDGAVISVVQMYRRDEIGLGSRTPKWAVAFKYPADTATSILRDIEVTVGRTGRLGLRCVIDPVTVGGTEITYASAHNIPWVEASGILINGYVTVYRAGDVIPRVTAPANIDQPADAYPWTAPTACPQCDEPLDTSSLLYRCTTPDCSIVGRIAYAAGRDQLDIDGLGDEIATALVESGLVTNIADLYDLTADQIASVQLGTTDAGNPRLIGDTVAAKLHAQITQSKQAPFNRIITALGIRKTGRTMGRRLAAVFPTMDALRAASIDDLTTVEGVATDKATYIYNGLRDMSDVIDRLAAAGVNMGAEPDPAAASDLPLAGMTVVVSGSVPGVSRNEANEWIERLGGKSSSSVSKNTSLLVTAETTTSKAVKAAELGVTIMPPEEFAAMIAAAQ